MYVCMSVCSVCFVGFECLFVRSLALRNWSRLNDCVSKEAEINA